MITYTRHGVRRGEVYFDEPIPQNPPVDILYCVQHPVPVPGFECTPFYTVVLDATLSAEELLRNCKKQTRNVIRRAGDVGFSIERTSDIHGTVFAEIQSEHRAFAKSRHIADMDVTRIAAVAKAGQAMINLLRSPSGIPLAWLVWYVNDTRARGLVGGSCHSVHLPEEERAISALANTYLCWEDILYFRKKQISIVDLGGWYVGADQKMLNINRFKAGFRGRIVEEFHCRRARTAVGKIAELLKRARHPRLNWAKFPAQSGRTPVPGLRGSSLGNPSLSATGRFE